MERQEALNLVNQYIKTRNLVKHSLAVEAAMRALAKCFGEDEELWGITGLLHDLDYEETKNDFERHALVTAELLADKGLPEEVIYCIKAHPGHFPTRSRFDKALYAVDPLTGLIVAAALMHPTKKLRNVDTTFVMNRFKEKRFAAGASREDIKTCQEIDLELEKFVEIVLGAMQGIAGELGL